MALEAGPVRGLFPRLAHGSKLAFTAAMDIDKDLQELVAAAIERGFEEYGNGKHDLVPFAMTEDEDGSVGSHTFVSDTLDEAIHLARNHVRRHAGAISRYAIVTTGFVSINGKRRNAMLVEAGEVGGDVVITAAQPFKRKGLIRKSVKRFTDLAIFGRSETPLGADEFEDDFDDEDYAEED